jgi:alpha-L-fucosidase
MKAKCILLLVAGCFFAAVAAAAETQAPDTTPPAVAKRLDAWRAAKFGMFIHWGPVSLKGTEIGWSRGAQIPVEEYDALYKKFNPTAFNADEWMKIAHDAGMKYVVFTTKHHDGFCMWDTKQTDFNIMHSPFGRDVVKELAAAAKRHALPFGTYHSVCDWHHPDFPLTSPGGRVRREKHDLDRYDQYLRNQVGELLRNYGPLWVMWFDVPQEFDAKRGQALIDFARSIQPDLIVNNRSGARGDYDTPEQHVGKFQFGRPWETCMTICQQWAWKPNDAMKSLKECLHTLALCAGGDGNLLFNVGPMPDGRIEPRQVERLREMGAWLAKYGESIYGTRGGPWKPTGAIASTRQGNTVYVHVLRWNGDTLVLPAIPAKIMRASLLTGGKVQCQQTDAGITISVPAADRQEIDTIVKLELDKPALEIPAVSLSTGVKATASNVYKQQDEFAAESAFDNDPHTRWATDQGTKQAWIAADYGRPVTFSGVGIQEAFAGRVQKFEFQCKDGEQWRTLFSGAKIGAKYAKKFPAVTAREIRLNILEASEGPTIAEIELLEQK